MNIYKHDILNVGYKTKAINGCMNIFCLQRTARFEMIILREALKKTGDYKIINIAFHNTHDTDALQNTIEFKTDLPVEEYIEIKKRSPHYTFVEEYHV